MEILDLRHMRSRDIEPLLEEEKSLWQRDLHWDYSSSAALIKRYIDACALPGYVAVEGGRTVGYCFYVYENFKGLIGDLFVSDSNGASAAEEHLLKHVIETLQATPGIRRIEAQLMNLRHQSPPDFRNGQNLQSFRRRFMVLSLADFSPVPAADIKLARWEERWVAEAAELITDAYRGHVDSAISDQYRSRAGALRFLDNIIHYPGCGEFDPECSFLAFHKNTSQPCGIVLSSVVGDRVSHITQVCVGPKSQGSGIGRALICHIIRKLRDRNFSAITLTVTNSNDAVRLYEKLGFTTIKEFHAFAWDAPG